MAISSYPLCISDGRVSCEGIDTFRGETFTPYIYHVWLFYYGLFPTRFSLQEQTDSYRQWLNIMFPTNWDAPKIVKSKFRDYSLFEARGHSSYTLNQS